MKSSNFKNENNSFLFFFFLSFELIKKPLCCLNVAELYMFLVFATKKTNELPY